MKQFFLGSILLSFLLVTGCNVVGPSNVQLQGVSGIPASTESLSIIDLSISVKNTGLETSNSYNLHINLIQNGNSTILNNSGGLLEIHSGSEASISKKIVLPLDAVGDCTLEIHFSDDLDNQSVIIKNIEVLPVPKESESNDSRYGNASFLQKNKGVEGEVTSELDEDWFILPLNADSIIGILIDGNLESLAIEIFQDNDATSLNTFTDDNFSSQLVLANSTGVNSNIYLRIDSPVNQKYWIIVEEL
ncbi:MAG: hypothetical protein JEY91_09690 [Spirochaetaceae bacterium]|nr:hypothetical protein [Spirochaetaceae bacterium]